MQALMKRALRVGCWSIFIISVAAATYVCAWNNLRWPQSPYAAVNICGHYVQNFGRNPNFLFIYRNHKYLHLYYLSKRRIYMENWGRWGYSHEPTRNSITFSGFVSRSSGSPGYWAASVQRSWSGQPEFCIDPDVDKYYVRRW